MTSYRRVLRLVAVLLVALTLFSAAPATPAAAVDDAPISQIRDRIEYLINRSRARHGLRRLRVGSYIQRRAQGHAANMAERGYIYHDSNIYYELPNDAEAWGENVARTSSSSAARRVHEMFMGSSTHRENILRRRYTHMGIGVVRRGNYVYVVERFVDRW